MLRRLAGRVLAGVGLLVLGAICLLVLSLFFGGPTLRITSAWGRAHVDTQFLGEYDLGLTKLSVTGPSGVTVLQIVSPDEPVNGVFDLVVGKNSVEALA